MKWGPNFPHFVIDLEGLLHLHAGCLPPIEKAFCQVCAFVCQSAQINPSCCFFFFFLSHLRHTSSKSKYSRPCSGKITVTLNSCMQDLRKRKTIKKSCNISRLYLGLFVNIPGEGDGVVGDFFNIVDCVEAFFVISCEGGKKQNE